MARFYPLPGVWRNVKLGTGNLSHRGRKLAISTIHVATHRDRANAVGLQSVGWECGMGPKGEIPGFPSHVCFCRTPLVDGSHGVAVMA